MPNDNKLIRAFGEEHVAQLTGLSVGQLRAWDRAGFFQPELAYEDRHSAYSRVYSFNDVVGLRTIAVLMCEHGVSLQNLKQTARELQRRGFKDWATLSLYVIKGNVYFQKPGTRDVEGVWNGQYAMLDVIDVIDDVRAGAEALSRRSGEQIGKIEQRRFVARHSPVIAGTRIPIAAIRRFSEAGYSPDQIIEQYPSLTREDIEAALRGTGSITASA